MKVAGIDEALRALGLIATAAQGAFELMAEQKIRRSDAESSLSALARTFNLRGISVGYPERRVTIDQKSNVSLIEW